MERLDFRRTGSTALVAELRRHAGLDETGDLRGLDARPGDLEPEPRTGLAASARSTLVRSILRPGATRLAGGGRV